MALIAMRVLFLLLITSPLFSNAQIKDSAKTLTVDSVKIHSPVKASVMSMILPGLGQIYNRKYWKLPIIYGGIGAGIFFINNNYHIYNIAKQTYISRIDGEIPPVTNYDQYSDAQLLSEIESYRRYTELAIIGTAAIYLLNIVDASVDAHLFYFNVSDDLSVNIQPTIFPSFDSNGTFVGGTLSLKF